MKTAGEEGNQFVEPLPVCHRGGEAIVYKLVERWNGAKTFKFSG